MLRTALQGYGAMDPDGDRVVRGTEIAARAGVPLTAMPRTVSGDEQAQFEKMSATMRKLANPTIEEAQQLGAEFAVSLRSLNPGMDEKTAERLGGRATAALLNGSLRAEQEKLPHSFDVSDVAVPRGLPSNGKRGPSGPAGLY